MFRRMRRALARRRLDTHLALVFGGTVALALIAIVFYVNSQVVAIVDRASQTLFTHMANESRAHIDKSVSGVDMLTRLFASDPQAARLDTAGQEAFVQRLRVVLDATPYISAVYIGYGDGGFVLLRQLTSPVARRTLDAPEDANYLLEVIRPGAPGGAPASSLEFLDSDMHRLGTLDKPDLVYDPRTRDWYRQASSQGAIMTDPYRFFITDESGVTMARRLQGGDGVVGVDLALADLSQELRRMRSTPSTQLLIVNAGGAVVAASDPALEATIPQPDGAASGDALPAIVPDMLAAARSEGGWASQPNLPVDGRQWVMRVVPLQSDAWTFRLALATPLDEMLASAQRLVSTLGWISVALVAAVLVAIQTTARAVSRPLVAIAQEAEAIQSFHFKEDAAQGVRSSVKEIDTLSQAIRNARLTIQRFIEIGQALAAENDPGRLMERLLQETISIAGAEGGLILLTEDGGQTCAVVRPGGRTVEGGLAARPERLSHGDGQFSEDVLGALGRRAISHFDSPCALPDALFADLVPDPSLPPGKVFRFTVIPLRNRADDVIGGLLLVLRAHPDDPISDERLDLARALSGNASIAIETTLLLKARKSLLDAVIRMIAQATDAKSPYTGGHCQRVPLLTQALARAACAADSGPYADFTLTPEDWEAVDVASWLHDCGKLTTAEYVMDKATKLETINDRIHEIRMRFELLKAEAHAAYWRGLAMGGDEAALAAGRDAELAALDRDFAFVAASNEGGEQMTETQVARLRDIARRTWLRTLDDRIGISADEKRRKSQTPAPVLPVREPLLADRPDHIIPHFSNRLSELEAQAGFRLQRPDHRMNLGELYNLSIGRGTLTPEERFEINRHITRTIVMLEDLPLAGALKQVPEFAGGHHEKMDGSGYPRGLRRDEMSVVARMMAIADVFEALTAADRPYKKAKPLSEAIRIMGNMKRDHHLDPDLLDLFLTSGVWRDYALRHLDPAQIDAPDIDAVLAIRPA